MGKNSGERNEAHVHSVSRALMLLDLLAKENREMALIEIASELSWPKTTAHGIVATLCSRQYVDQSPSTGRYRLGVRLFELGSIVARNWDVRTIAKPAMQDLNNRLGETIQLATETNGEVLYIEKLDSTHIMRIVSDIGTRLPMHCTGLGKVLLAYKTYSEIKWIVAKHGLCKMTARTITDWGKLERELIRIRRQGYAVDDREIMDSLRCVAAPIYDRNGSVEYAISVSGFAKSFQGSRFDMVCEELLKTAESISYTMGYRNPDEQSGTFPTDREQEADENGREET